jgi:pyruvate,water dikinase
MVVYHGSGTITTDVPGDIQERPCIDSPELQEIVRISQDVEKHFQVPQDMEWVVDQGRPFPENLFWVQARPAKYAQVKEKEAEYLAELMTRLFKF